MPQGEAEARHVCFPKFFCELFQQQRQKSPLKQLDTEKKVTWEDTKYLPRPSPNPQCENALEQTMELSTAHPLPPFFLYRCV